MSKKRDKVREHRRRIWEDAKLRQLNVARQRIGLGPDELIPDAVLLGEVDGYLPVHEREGGWEANYWLKPRQQWFGFRLMGLADTEEERIALAHRLRTIRSGFEPFGLDPGGVPRHSPAAGRRRRRRHLHSN